MVLWKQIIEKVKTEKIKNVVLVTGDRKSDWWWIEKGKTIGPHRELVEELKKEAGVELFWMFNSAKFIENANKYANTDVSDFSLNELRDAEYMTARELMSARWSDEWRGCRNESQDINRSPFEVIVNKNEKFWNDGLVSFEHELDEKCFSAVAEYIENNLGLDIFKKKYGGLWLCSDEFGAVHEFAIYAIGNEKRSNVLRGEIIEFLSSLNIGKFDNGAMRSNLIVFSHDLSSIYELDKDILGYIHDGFGINIYCGVVLHESFMPIFLWKMEK